jgi:16S rRNA processing protein RimM
MPDEPDHGGKFIPLGRILRAHGVHGAVVASFYGDDPAAILDKAAQLFLLPKEAGLPKRIRIINGKEATQGLILKISRIRTREEAESLKGLEFASLRSALPDAQEDELYLYDLIGLRSETHDGRPLGQVAGFLETGAGVVLSIKDQNGKESLVPWQDEFIKKTDLENGLLVIEDIPGLLE